jgi:hypothetical protein
MQNAKNPDVRELRQFGLVLGAAFSLMLGLVVPWLLGVAFPVWPWPIAVVLWTMAAVVPKALRPVYKIWMGFTHGLNWVVSRAALVVVYYVVVVPTAIVMRLSGKDPMRRRVERDAATYRIPAERLDKKHLERPF